MPRGALVHTSLCVAFFTLFATVPGGAWTITTVTYQITDADESMTSQVIGVALNKDVTVDTVDLTPLEDTRVVPETCPAGSYSTLNSSTCTKCPAGTYSPTTSAVSQDACIGCEAGSYSGASGASSSDTCMLCAVDEYSTVVGGASSAVCETCPTNSHSPAGSQSISACVCDPGYVGPNGGPCSVCEADVW